MADLKHCFCCLREHTPEQWASLELVGAQQGLDGVWLELRNCLCRTTLALAIDAERAEVVRAEVAQKPKGIDYEQLFRLLSGRG